MRGPYKRKNRDSEDLSPGPGPGPGESRTSGLRTGVRCFSRNMYAGVRVRMPVKEMLKNIRVAKGVDPQQIKERCDSSVKGEMKRVKSRSKVQKMKQQHSTNDELSIIIEVLEEDLRTSNTSSPPHTHNYFINVSPESPQLALTGPPCDEDDEIVAAPGSSPGSRYSGCRAMRNHGEPAGGEDDWSSAHSGPQLFWAQLQQEERLLSSISSSVLLSTDQHGRTALHKAASVGKRLLGYAIAKRMSALCRLDLTDCDGMTPLLYAAQNNHPLIVADLIYLGADVNVKNMSGKTLLHLSAERGYIRVLQAVKCAMMCGVYVDVEATDEAGMSVLQCAVLSMKASVCDSTSSSRIQDQMMETVECLLQMDSYLHTTKGTSVGSY